MKKVACDIGALPICHRQLFIFLMLRRNIKTMFPDFSLPSTAL